ncbi:hypothetical protein BST61_g10096 [Cercospora zeina]
MTLKCEPSIALAVAHNRTALSRLWLNPAGQILRQFQYLLADRRVETETTTMSLFSNAATMNRISMGPIDPPILQKAFLQCFG